jgi:hypothetical protein
MRRIRPHHGRPAIYPGLMQLPFNNEHQWRERPAPRAPAPARSTWCLVAERDGHHRRNSGLHPERRRRTTCAAAMPRRSASPVAPEAARAGCRHGADAGDVQLRRPLDRPVCGSSSPSTSTTPRRSRSTASSASRSGTLSRLCDARRPSCRCRSRWPRIHPAPPTIEPAVPAGLPGAPQLRVASAHYTPLPCALGPGRRRRRGAGLVSQPRRRGQRAGRPHRPLVSGRRRQPGAPAPSVALFHGCGGAFDRRGQLSQRMQDYAASSTAPAIRPWWSTR